MVSYSIHVIVEFNQAGSEIICRQIAVIRSEFYLSWLISRYMVLCESDLFIKVSLSIYNNNTLLIRMDHYFWPKFAKLDPTHESGQAFESGPA